MARVSQRGLARELGFNPGHVNRLVKRGTIQVGADGMIDLEQARAAIAGARALTHTHMDEVNARQRAASGRTAAAPADELPADTGAEGSASTRRQFDRARTIRESFNASLVRLEFQQKSGLLVDRATAEKVLFEKARHARDAWLGWPSKTAPLIAAELGLENSDALMAALTAHVHKQIASLGSDVADFRSDAAA